MNEATTKILDREELEALIRRQKEMAEKLEASLRGGASVSSNDISQAEDDFRRIMESIRAEPDFRDALVEVSPLILRQMEAIRHLHDEEKDTADERPRSLH
ncbi:hypothetical protein D3C71_152590 [compost metagenome]